MNLRVLINAVTGAAVICCDKSGLVEMMNTDAQQMLGYVEEEVAGKSTPLVFHLPAEMASRAAGLAREYELPVEGIDVLLEPARRGDEQAREWTYLRKDGSNLTVSLTVTALRDANGAVAGYFCIAADIARRRRLGDARARLAAILEHSYDAIVFRDIDGTIRSWSAGAERMFGFTAREAIGKPVSFNAVPGKTPIFKDVTRRVLEGEILSPYLTGRMHKDGRRLDVMTGIFPVRNDDGAIISIASIFHDVTETKRYESELKRANLELDRRVAERTAQLLEREQQLQRAHRIARLGHWAVNLQTGELSWCDEIFRIFGRQPESFVPSQDNFFSVVHPDDRELIRSVQRRASRSDGLFSVDHRIVLPNGEIRWVHEEAVIDHDSSGVPLSMTGTVQDITDRKQLEQDLNAARLEAERQSRDKSDFLIRVGHELRTPLNAILGFAQLLELDRPILNREQRESVGQILSGGRTLLELINDFLELGQIDTGRLELQMTHVDAGELMDECLAALRGEADAAGVTVRHVPCNIRALVCADRGRLREVFLGLLRNAIECSGKGGRVEAGCKTDGQALVFSVRDTGGGIAAEELANLFDPYRKTSLMAGGRRSAGLGLALSRKLVELMGGEVQAESVSGKGSVFHVRLDRAAADDAPALQIHQGTSTHAEGEGAILYVDDDESNCALMRAVLRKMPCRLVVAGTGEKAMELVEQGLRPDLVLLDINLPGMSGFDVLEELRLKPEFGTVPIMAMSAGVFPEQIERVMAAGFSRFIQKPVMLDDLKEVLAGIRIRHGGERN